MRSRPYLKAIIYLSTLAGIVLITLLGFPRNKESQPSEVRFMTFNIRFDNPDDGENAWPNRLDMVCSILNDYRSDFIGLQEVLPHQMEEIMEGARGYQSIFRTREADESTGEASPILFDESRWLLIHSGTFWLSDTPYESGSNTWGAACNRIATWGKFREKESKKSVFLINTHLDHVSQTAREKSITLILRQIFILSEGAPVVFMGDLNVEEEDPVYWQVLNESGLTDAYRVVHPEPTEKDLTFNGWKTGEGISRIDYVFTSGDFSIKTARVIKTMWNGRYPSDHFPVLVTADF